MIPTMNCYVAELICNSEWCVVHVPLTQIAKEKVRKLPNDLSQAKLLMSNYPKNAFKNLK